MTDRVETLKALVERWRAESGSWEPGIGSGIGMCADELDALIAAGLSEAPAHHRFDQVLQISALVNAYHNDGTTLTAAETLLAIADVLGPAMGMSVESLSEAPAPQEHVKVREHLVRLAKAVTRPTKYGFQMLRRDREDDSIEYQIFADTKGHGTQIAWVQSTRHDAEFLTACLAQAPLFAELLASPAPPKEPNASR